MIVAVCLNAALDVTYRVAELVPGESVRVLDVSERSGGKGVNVARVAHQLGADVRVTGFVGGTTGTALVDELARFGVPAEFVPLAAATRRCVTVVAGSQATVLNEPGPVVSPDEWAALLATTADWTEADVVVLSGSVPPGAPADAYGQLITAARHRGARTVLDAEGPALLAGLAAGPDVVAPNRAEAASALGSIDISAPDAARRLRSAGASAAVVSCGPDGLVAATDGETFRAAGSRTVDGNPTGAGDALTAALALGLATGAEWPQTLRDAVATSAAAVAVPHAGEVDLAVRAQLLPTVTVEPLVEVS